MIDFIDWDGDPHVASKRWLSGLSSSHDMQVRTLEFDVCEDSNPGETVMVFPRGSTGWSLEITLEHDRGIGLGVKLDRSDKVYAWGFEPMDIPLETVKKLTGVILAGQGEIIVNRLLASEFGSRYLLLPTLCFDSVRSTFHDWQFLRLRRMHSTGIFYRRIPLSLRDFE